MKINKKLAANYSEKVCQDYSFTKSRQSLGMAEQEKVRIP